MTPMKQTDQKTKTYRKDLRIKATPHSVARAIVSGGASRRTESKTKTRRAK